MQSTDLEKIRLTVKKTHVSPLIDKQQLFHVCSLFHQYILTRDPTAPKMRNLHTACDDLNAQPGYSRGRSWLRTKHKSRLGRPWAYGW